MLGSNRTTDRIIKDIPTQIRNTFVLASTAGATREDITKMFEVFEESLDEYKRTILEDAAFVAECRHNPYVEGSNLKHTYPHLLHVLKTRIDQAHTEEERELLRRQHYNKLEDYKYMSAPVLGPIVDRLAMQIETPSWIETILGRFEKKPKMVLPKKQPAITPNPKSFTNTSTQNAGLASATAIDSSDQ